jgi:hypothetical protein
MKNVSKFFYAVMVLLAAVLSSCDKDVETSPVTTEDFAKGTIKGYVYAQLDLTNYGYEAAPVGSKVIITMPYSELGLNNSGNLIDTVLLGSDGSFSYEIPADGDGVNVTVKVIDFIYKQKQAFGDQHDYKNSLYSSKTVTYNVKANDLQVQEIYLDAPTYLGEVFDWYTVEGTIYLDYDKSTSGYEKLPAGTKVTFNCDGWSKEVTVGTDGKYTVSVPYGEYIYMDYNFTLSGKLSSGTTVTYRFKGSSYQGVINADTKGKDISLADGVTE